MAIRGSPLYTSVNSCRVLIRGPRVAGRGVRKLLGRPSRAYTSLTSKKHRVIPAISFILRRSSLVTVLQSRRNRSDYVPFYFLELYPNQVRVSGTSPYRAFLSYFEVFDEVNRGTWSNRLNLVENLFWV